MSTGTLLRLEALGHSIPFASHYATSQKGKIVFYEQGIS